jgi:hypothetical protein
VVQRGRMVGADILDEIGGPRLAGDRSRGTSGFWRDDAVPAHRHERDMVDAFRAFSRRGRGILAGA